MKKIEEVVMYKCPETGKMYKTKRGAINSAKKALEKAKAEENLRLNPQRKSYIQENAQSIPHALGLVKEKANEFWDIEIKELTLQSRKTTLPLDGLIYGDIDGLVNKAKVKLSILLVMEKSKCKSPVRTEDMYYFLSDNLFNSWQYNRGFLGFSLADKGCSQFSLSADGLVEFIFRVEIEIKNFPKMWPLFKEWLESKNRENEYLKTFNLVRHEAIRFFQDRPEIKNLRYYTSAMRSALATIDSTIKELHSYHVEAFTEKWRNANQPPVIAHFDSFGE